MKVGSHEQKNMHNAEVKKCKNGAWFPREQNAVVTKCQEPKSTLVFFSAEQMRSRKG